MPELLHVAGDFFATPDGQAVYLAGNHTWTDLQQIGPTPFDFAAYLKLLSSEHANMIRLWAWSAGIDGGGSYGPVTPLPYVKLASGKYDLTQFNASYFSNLQSKVQQAAANGDYTSVMLFDGWSVNSKGSSNNPWLTNPLNANNNVNGIDGDPNKTGNGDYTQTLADPKILAVEEAYVAKVIDTVGHDSNVLFEVANETAATPQAIAWQNTIVDFIHAYESSHGDLAQPVGITAPWSPDGTLSSSQINAALHASEADWISPSSDGYANGSTPASGGKPSIIVDTDHVYGIGGNAGWVWEQFTDGNSVLSMDNLDGTGIAGTLPGVQLSSDLIAAEKSDRLGITETRQVAELVNVTGMAASNALSSTGYALADPSNGKYIVYAPSGGTFTVNLSRSAGQTLGVQWMDVNAGKLSSAASVQGGSSQQSFTAPTSVAALVLTPQSSGTPSSGGSGSGSSPGTGGTTGSGTGGSSSTGSAPGVIQGGTFGTGSDTLVLTLAEDAYQGDAQANASIDGALLTATPITVTALQSAGQTEVFTFKGNFGTGSHSIAVTFLNDAYGGSPSLDRNLFVDGVSLNGTSVSTGSVTFDGNPSIVTNPAEIYTAGDTATYAASGGTNPPSSGSGSGTGSTTGSTGNTGGTTGSGTGGSSSTGSAPGVIQGGTFGAGSDTLVLSLAEDAYQGDAQANVSIDGALLTATPITVTALQSAGQTETFTFKGNFGSGNHNVVVTFLNDTPGNPPSEDRNLYVDGVSLDGNSVSGGIGHYSWGTYPVSNPVPVYGTGDTASFSVSGGTNPPSSGSGSGSSTATGSTGGNGTSTGASGSGEGSSTGSAPGVIQGGTFGTGSDTLVLTLAEDAYQGDAQANVSIDGAPLTATPITVTALQSAGQTETFTFKGNFGTASHSIAVTFLNDAYGGSPSLDRNLFVDGVSWNGRSVNTASVSISGSASTVTNPAELYTTNDSAVFQV